MILNAHYYRSKIAFYVDNITCSASRSLTLIAGVGLEENFAGITHDDLALFPNNVH